MRPTASLSDKGRRARPAGRPMGQSTLRGGSSAVTVTRACCAPVRPRARTHVKAFLPRACGPDSAIPSCNAAQFLEALSAPLRLGAPGSPGGTAGGLRIGALRMGALPSTTLRAWCWANKRQGDIRTCAAPASFFSSGELAVGASDCELDQRFRARARRKLQEAIGGASARGSNPQQDWPISQKLGRPTSPKVGRIRDDPPRARNEDRKRQRRTRPPGPTTRSSCIPYSQMRKHKGSACNSKPKTSPEGTAMAARTSWPRRGAARNP